MNDSFSTKGFTLLEIVIVMVIVAIMLMGVQWSLSRFSDPTAILNEKVKQVALVISALRDEAIIKSRPMGLSYTDSIWLEWEYHVESETWDINPNLALNQIDWPNGVSFNLFALDGSQSPAIVISSAAAISDFNLEFYVDSNLDSEIIIYDYESLMGI